MDLDDGTRIVSRVSICATGVEYRRLGLPDENRLFGAGVYYGAGASEAQLCGNFFSTSGSRADENHPPKNGGTVLRHLLSVDDSKAMAIKGVRQVVRLSPKADNPRPRKHP